MNYSSDVVADAVRAYWKTYYPRTVIAFFYQKYEHDLEWEWCEELVECNASDDYETVIFQNDFCEGQTCVKDISIVPLEDIIDYYTEKHIKCLSLTYPDVPDTTVGDMISRQAAIDGLYEMSSDIDHLCTLGDYVSFLESLSAQPERTGKWIVYESDNDKYEDIRCPFCKFIYTVDAYHWTDIGFTKDDLEHCPHCGARMEG